MAAVDDADVHGVAQRKDAKPDVAPRSCDRILIDVPELPGRAERRVQSTQMLHNSQSMPDPKLR